MDFRDAQLAPDRRTLALLLVAPMTAQATMAALRARLEAGIVGQGRLVEHLLVALLADGHALLEGAPGLAKTRIARQLAESLEGTFKRVQFTPDLLPSDLTGTAIYDPREHRFDFQRGPLFANFVLADEINRAPAKVQSALLEAMEERQITSGEQTYPLDPPFFVIATQNPIEHEGTWELPRAQLDRFLLHIVIDHPSRTAEREILELVMAETIRDLGKSNGEARGLNEPPIPREKLAEARRAVLDVHVSDLVKDYIVRLIAGTRNDPQPLDGVGEHLEHPVSPRGSITLARVAQARAWLGGRDHVLPEDVEALAGDALRHRLGLTYRAETDGVLPDSIVAALLDQVRVV